LGYIVYKLSENLTNKRNEWSLWRLIYFIYI
jgi:hypothetical protein